MKLPGEYYRRILANYLHAKNRGRGRFKGCYTVGDFRCSSLCIEDEFKVNGTLFLKNGKSIRNIEKMPLDI